MEKEEISKESSQEESEPPPKKIKESEGQRVSLPETQEPPPKKLKEFESKRVIIPETQEPPDFEKLPSTNKEKGYESDQDSQDLILELEDEDYEEPEYQEYDF